MQSASDTRLNRREFRRILIIKPSSLGDVIHALPVLHGLRIRYPQAHIAWLVAKPFIPLIEGHPELDEVIEFDRKRFGRLGRSLGVTRPFVRFVTALRRREFDLVLDLQGLFRSGFFAWATGAKVRVGFREARELAWLFYSHRIPRQAPDTHAVDRNYEVGRLLGFEDVLLLTDLALTGEERDRARALLAKVGLAEDEPFAAVLPGARWETKQWLPERFAEAIDRLKSEAGLRSVLLGSPDERSLCESISNRCSTRPPDLAGRTTLRQLAAVIERAALVLCHDSGPMHMAAALGKPMVTLVGPTNPLRTGPYRRMETVLRVDLACAPCYLRRLSQCPHGHECMKAIRVEDVVVRATKALEAIPANTDK